MAVKRKGRRKITVGDRHYVWYITDDDLYDVLHIISEDKKFIVHYHLGQSVDSAYVTVLGQEFGGTENTGGPWRRFRCPKWDENEVVTSKTISSIIEWGLLETKTVTEVDCYGRKLPLSPDDKIARLPY